MVYFLLALAFLIFIIYSLTRKNEEKILAETRLNWGRKINKRRDLLDVEEYATHSKKINSHKLTLQTLIFAPPD